MTSSMLPVLLKSVMWILLWQLYHCITQCRTQLLHANPNCLCRGTVLLSGSQWKVAQWFKQLKASRPFRTEKAERADIAHYTLFMLEGYVEFPKLVAEYLMSPILIVLLNTNCKLRYSVTNTNVNPTLFLMPCKLLWGITNLQCCNSCHLPSDFHPNFNHA